MWIKICGLTTQAAVDIAVSEGVDAIGFVFAPSKRQVNAVQAAELARNVPSSVLRIAVMQHPDQGLVDEICSVFKPNILQSDQEDFLGLTILQGFEKLPVVRAGKNIPAPLPTRMLFEGPVSGTGQTADWTKATELAKQTQLILAGGLNPSNVQAAIAQVRPFGVDVSSGVESAPGVKDVKKIVEFVRRARGRSL
jgi:phosphoribosylanthranilate isomerase